MADFILNLSFKNNVSSFDLFLKEPDDVLKSYPYTPKDNLIYCDHAYSLLVTNKIGEKQHIDNAFVNNEPVNKKVLDGYRSDYLFLDCFGVIRIEIIIDGISYITENISVMVKETSFNTNVLNMIDYIYDNCNDYLYEEHKHSKNKTGINTDLHVSLDSKLSLLQDIYNSYIKCFSVLRYSAKSKLINIDKVGDFSELHNIHKNTICYIVNHPEELQAVNYNSGIKINKQYYQPNKTLVNTVAYSTDIYENQVIVGFLKTIIKELHNMTNIIISHKKRNSSFKKKDGYVESSYYIYTRNIKMLDEYLDIITQQISKFQQLFNVYSSMLNVTDFNLNGPPKLTNIFRNIMPYNLLFTHIVKWFCCGNYDLLKSDLLLSFVSLSKIYEYFCLLKIINSLKINNYNLKNEFSFKYDNAKYYINTKYNNTFEFEKENIKVKLFYQPVVYGTTRNNERFNDIYLYRTTSTSIAPTEAFAITDDNDANQGNFYCPDFIIKITKGDFDNYYILDAKHSTPNNIKRYQLPYLAYKYLFSLDSISKNATVTGLYILCGKTDKNSEENIYDIAETLDKTVLPEALILNVSGADVYDDNDLSLLIQHFETIEKD